MARLVIVSNRVPIPKARSAAAGGLAWRCAILTPGACGSAGAAVSPPSPRPQPALVEARGVTYATIDLTAEALSRYSM